MPTTIQIGHGFEATVDDEDAERVLQHKWHPDIREHTIYAMTNIKENGRWRSVRLHRFIVNAPKGALVDHEDGNGLNCQRHNLRYTDSVGNRTNCKAKNPRRKGVRRKKGSFVAVIGHLGKKIELGGYKCRTAAAVNYDRKAVELYGEFSRLNYPEINYRETTYLQQLEQAYTIDEKEKR